MPLPDDPARRHLAVAGRFGEIVAGTTDWDAPTPVAGWLARDVVRHLTEWMRGFLAAGADVKLAEGPGADVDPVATWQVHAAAIQAVLDDPDVGQHRLADPHLGEIPLDAAIDRFYTSDVFMHTWDLARATGQDDRLDPTFCAGLLSGMQPMEEVIRSSGHYGPAVPVPADADVQTRLLGFIGRDPDWQARAV